LLLLVTNNCKSVVCVLLRHLIQSFDLMRCKKSLETINNHVQFRDTQILINQTSNLVIQNWIRQIFWKYFLFFYTFFCRDDLMFSSYSQNSTVCLSFSILTSSSYLFRSNSCASFIFFTISQAKNKSNRSSYQNKSQKRKKEEE